MKYVGLILALLLAANASRSDEIQALGSKKRKHPQQIQINIEDIIRAEEDPDFSQYLIERQHQKKEERAAAIAYEKQRQAEEDAIKMPNVNISKKNMKELPARPRRYENTTLTSKKLGQNNKKSIAKNI